MENPVQHYWEMRLDSLKQALEENNFQVAVSPTAADARDLVLDQILPETGANSLSWGGSGTFKETGLYEALKSRTDIEIVDTYDASLSLEDKLERRRQALLVDLFFTGTNAITESGMLVNLDMIGNRVGAMTFGPRHVVVLAGRNKIVSDLDQAFERIKNFTAPVNSMRLDMKTPCTKTSYCQDCQSAQRICNTWTIHEKSFPNHRIKIVLINQDMGL